VREKSNKEIILIIENPKAWTKPTYRKAKSEFEHRTISDAEIKRIAVEIFTVKCKQAAEVHGFSRDNFIMPHSDLLDKTTREEIFHDAVEEHFINRSLWYSGLDSYG